MKNTKLFSKISDYFSFKKMQARFASLTGFFEIIITLIVAFSVIVSIRDLIKFLPILWDTPSTESYGVLRDFLAHALLIVVAVELMAMLMNHSLVSLLELVLFVIARKMLIYATNMQDLVLGTISILIISIIFRFMLKRTSSGVLEKSVEFSGDTTIQNIQNYFGVWMSYSSSFTIAEVIRILAKEDHRKIEKGAKFYIGDLIVTIIDEDDGEINHVFIYKKQDEE